MSKSLLPWQRRLKRQAQHFCCPKVDIGEKERHDWVVVAFASQFDGVEKGHRIRFLVWGSLIRFGITRSNGLDSASDGGPTIRWRELQTKTA